MTEKINKEQIEIIPLFPIPLVRTNIGRDFTKDELQLLFSDIPMYKDTGEGVSNHRSKDFYLFDNEFAERLKGIKKFCELQLVWYLENIEGVDTDLATLRITQSWLNKNKPNESHPRHFHPNSYLSAVLYITCLPNDSINLENRAYGLYNNMIFPKKKTTNWNSSGFKQNVTEGDLIIFPSWVLHHVDLNETKNRERISLSFDTFPIGEMGDYGGATHLKL